MKPDSCLANATLNVSEVLMSNISVKEIVRNLSLSVVHFSVRNIVVHVGLQIVNVEE